MKPGTFIATFVTLAIIFGLMFEGIINDQAMCQKPKPKTIIHKGKIPISAILDYDTNYVFKDLNSSKITLWQNPLNFKPGNIWIYDSSQRMVAQIDTLGNLTVYDSLATIKTLLFEIKRMSKY